jgi:hypothetical protein
MYGFALFDGPFQLVGGRWLEHVTSSVSRSPIGAALRNSDVHSDISRIVCGPVAVGLLPGST